MNQLLKEEYEELKAKSLSIDMTRGKPCKEQLSLSAPMLNNLTEDDFLDESLEADPRNYGVLEGLGSARELMASIMDEPASQTLVLGSSSLQLMYDTMARCMQFGSDGQNPWNNCDDVAFLCPAPGYDRHFSICENFGIKMIPIEMRSEGPDIQKIEELAGSDESIKGIWCVPQYSNPTGFTYSDEIVKRLASMKTAADDFRIFWDNAYCVHHLYDNCRSHVCDIAKACREAGHEERYFKFASLSKVTFPGAAIAAFGASVQNIAEAKKRLGAQMIGSDKINQLRHVKFLASKSGIESHMAKHAEILRPKFELIESKLENTFASSDDVRWSTPKGGYFISFNTPQGCAKRTVEIAGELGVKFTPAGSTYPYKNDPRNENIRIAPSMPTLGEIESATDVLVLATKIAAEERD